MTEDVSQCAHRTAWKYIGNQQKKFDNPNISESRQLARNESIDLALDKIVANQAIDPNEADQLERNRSRKYRRQKEILLTNYATSDDLFDDGSAAEKQAIQNEEIANVRQSTTDFEWTCLWRLANGSTYADLSSELQMKASSLRSLASRCRKRLQQELAIAA